jgi:hypothetical protein
MRGEGGEEKRGVVDRLKRGGGRDEMKKKVVGRREIKAVKEENIC